jgi:PAS domain S-box-containing protein
MHEGITAKLRILDLEDDPLDAELVHASLTEAGIECEMVRVQTREEFVGALEGEDYDLILSDYSLPSFDGLSALRVALEMRPEIPFILVSGTLGEEMAIEALKSGATDYVLKQRLERIVPAVRRAVREADERKERRRAEEALRGSEERYRAVIEQATDGIYLLDTETGRILETNPAFQRMLGYAAGQLEGMEIYELLAHPRDDVDANLQRSLGDGRRLVGERKYRRKDETVVDVEVGVSTISYGGRVVVCAVVRDITERKQAEEALRRSEERFRSLVRYASDIILVLDADGTITYESPAVERALGFTPEERMGTNAFDYLHPEDVEPVRERLARIAEEPGARVSAEYRARNKEGGWRDFEAIGANLLDDPVIGGIVVNSRDVTERKRAEEALREIREAERSRMARDLHDGVLQDLSYVVQAMEITRLKAEGSGLREELQEEVSAIRRSIRDLRAAIYDLRLHRHRDQSTEQLLWSLVELNRQRNPECSIELSVSEGFFDELPEVAGMELLRIVQEALTNSRRHSGAKNVGVTLERSDGVIRAEIADDGRGFDMEAPPGTGTLGMRERARSLGGRLQVESEPGAGTTVRVVVSLEESADQA